MWEDVKNSNKEADGSIWWEKWMQSQREKKDIENVKLVYVYYDSKGSNVVGVWVRRSGSYNV